MPEPKLQCPGCLASFQTEGELDAHRRSYHGWFPDKIEQLRTERIDLLSEMVRQERARADAEQAARERAQQALREIERMLSEQLDERHYPLWLIDLWEIAKRGLEG